MNLFIFLKRIWVDYISSGLNITQDQAAKRVDSQYSEIRKIFFINFLGLFALIAVIAITIASYSRENLLGFLIQLTTIAIILGNVIALRITKKPAFSAFFLQLGVTLVLWLSLYYGNFSVAILIAFFLFTFLSFFLITKEISLVWNLILFIVSFGIVLTFADESYRNLFDQIAPEVTVLFLLSLLVNYFHQSIEDQNEKQMVESKKELANSFNQMVEEIEQRRKLESKLQSSLDESAKSNSQLEETQRAMLNVMEDLEHEKNSILKKQAEDESILGSIGDGLIVTDTEGIIKIVNKAFEDILGYDPLEVIGKKYLDAFSVYLEDGSKVDESASIVKDTVMTGKGFLSQIRIFESKNGDKIPVKVTTTPIMLDGNVTGAVQAFRDVTKELEVDKAKTEFVSLASHQLKTPLSAINWYTELLLSEDGGKLSTDQKEFVTEIQTGARRMNELVNALLNVSRIDLGTFAVDPEEIDIVELSDSVLDELKIQIANKHMNIVRNYQSNLPKFTADPKLMRIVLQNLLTNSIKYTPENGRIEVSIGANSKDMTFKVSDNGYGIPENQKDKIFLKLFRADNVLSKETDGTGLGLYIVKSIVEQSNGKIWFESEENKGTTFYITLPLEGMQKKEGSKALT